MIIGELTWQQYAVLPEIKVLPLNEQIRRYNNYINEVVESRMTLAQQTAAVSGGGGEESTDEFPGGGSGAVTFNGTNQYFTAPNAQVVNWLPGT